MFSKTSTFKTASQPAEKEADKAKPFFTGRQSAGTPFFSAAPASIQPKLTINAPGDKYEQEADEMAERVVQAQPIQRQTETGEEEELMQAKPLGEGIVQRKCAACEQEATLQRQSEPEEEEPMQAKRQETATVQRQCAACDPVATLQRQSEPEEEELMQAKPLMRASENGTATATPQLTSQLNSSKGGGQPLPKDTLSSMSSVFGADFSGVRVHTGSRAQEMSQGIQAKAFTHGSDIYFNKGQYNPGSTEGKRLLGHELTHVVQQGGNKTSIQRAVRENFVSCGSYNAGHPVIQAIGTNDPIGVIRDANTRAIEILDNTIADINYYKNQINGGAEPGWPTIADCFALSMRSRLRLDPGRNQTWTGRGPGTVELILRWYGNVRNILAGGWIRYTCLDRPSYCSGDTIASAIPGEYRIYLCRPFWSSNSDDFRAITLIHEAAHIYYSTEDAGRGPGSSYCLEDFIMDVQPINANSEERCGEKPEAC